MLGSPDLNSGMTLATLRSLGTTPVFRDKVKTWVRGSTIQEATFFTRLALISSCPAAESFNPSIMLWTSLEVGGSKLPTPGY